MSAHAPTLSVKDFLSKLLAQSQDERWTVKMARQHPLVQDYEYRAGTELAVAPNGSSAEGGVLSEDNPSALPEVTALPAILTGVPSLVPVESAPIAAELSVNIVEAMLLRDGLTSSATELSGAPSHLHLGPVSGKRKRGVSTSTAGPSQVAVNAERNAKRRRRG
ncbi:hypothetical protein FRB94_009246 [Tulasnella sp. JGI-2019a]|nr:hypothetical protein FRB94_009246 [Tulasnella sp. JGI-2019a]